MVFYHNSELINPEIRNVGQLTEVSTENEISKFINLLSERIRRMETIYVIDRFEGNYAICENRETGEMSNIEIQKLPKQAKEGSVLRLKNGEYVMDIKSQDEIEKIIETKMNNLWN